MSTRLLLAFVLTSMLVAIHLVAGLQAQGVSFTVDTLLDLIDPDTADGVCPVGSCSLRAAIMQANVMTGPGVTINVPAGIHTLIRPAAGADGPENGDLNLMAPPSGSPVISIVGAGAASTLIGANQIDRVLSVASLRTATISGVTIRNGYRLNGSGGGVSNSGTLTITDSVIESNQTDAAGGGIYSPGTLTIRRSTIRSNLAFLGGALWVHGIAAIRDSSLYGNGATYGGGIEVSAFNGASNVTIVNSTISQNYANTDGGGIDSEGDTFLYNTSVIDNDADHDRDMNGGRGGGISTNGSRFVVVNTLVARNTILDSPQYDDCYGTLEGYGWNLLGVLDRCTFTGNGIASRGIISLNTFGPLQNNGGPTVTHALLAGSEAIDTTYPQGCIDNTGATLTTDQRGRPRPWDGDNLGGARCDVGAYEFMGFVDDPLVAGGTVIRAVHITQLRTRIDAQRTRFGLLPFVWTALPAGTMVRALHVAELQTAMQQAYTSAGRTPPTFTDAPFVPQTTLIRAIHISQLRDAVLTLESS